MNIITNHKITFGQYIKSLISEYRIYFTAIVLIALFASIFEINVSFQIRKILDSIVIHHNEAINTLLITFIIYKLMQHGVYFIRRLFDIKYKPSMYVKVINDMYQRVMMHSLHWFESHLSGEISNKISDSESFNQITTSFFRVLADTLLVIMGMIFVFQVNTTSALIIMFFIIIYGPIMFILLKKQLSIQENFISTRQKVFGIINDSFVNIFGIKIIGNLSYETKNHLQPAFQKVAEADKKSRKFDAYFVDSTDTILITLMSSVQIYALSILYKNGIITPGDFTFVMMTTLGIHKYLESLVENLLFNVNPAIAQFKTSFDFINSPIDIMESTNPVKPETIKGDIKFENVCFSYKSKSNSNQNAIYNQKNVLENLNLHIKPHERIGIVGLSGAGKTTLIKCLIRYFDINDGNLLIDDHKISEIPQDLLRRNISIIPQDITMFHRSILDNLKIAKHEASFEEIIEACKMAKIHDDIMLMNDKYDSIVGERGVKLSGGQRQRIAIARAILKNAPILILDEATSALDTPTEKLIQKSLDDMFQNMKSTTLVIAHRLSTLLSMDRIVVLEKGRIVESGSHEELIDIDGIYKKLWDSQTNGFINK
jgi:ATP-binding cassette subfamily B protein